MSQGSRVLENARIGSLTLALWHRWFDVINDARRFDSFRPLHLLWKQYMDGMRGGSRNLEEQMFSADLHGCYMRIAACKEPRRVGLAGIVLRDSDRFLHIIAQDNRTYPIRKCGSIFETGISSDTVIELNGDQLFRRQGKQGGKPS